MGMTLEQRVERLENQVANIFTLVPDLQKYTDRAKKAGKTRTQNTLDRIIAAVQADPDLVNDYDRLAAIAKTSTQTIYAYIGRGLLKFENKLPV